MSDNQLQEIKVGQILCDITGSTPLLVLEVLSYTPSRINNPAYAAYDVIFVNQGGKKIQRLDVYPAHYQTYDNLIAFHQRKINNLNERKNKLIAFGKKQNLKMEE